MRYFRMLAALLTTILMPNYKVELLARTNGHSVYNLPQYSSLNSVSPSLNEVGDVSFKINSVGEVIDQSVRAAVWFKSHDEIKGRVVYTGPNDKMMSDTQVTNDGEVIFSIYDEFKSEGLFSYSQDSQNTRLIFSDLKIYSMANPQSMGNETYIFRSTDSDNIRTYFEYRNNNLALVLSEDHGYAFLFPPRVNPYGQWIFKARLGDQGHITENSPDQIIKLSPQYDMLGKKTYSSQIIAKDQDADITSSYLSFDNSPSISQNGHIVFVATMNTNKRAIIAVKDGQHYEIIREGEKQISQIELFSPKINDNGLVVFRAKDNQGRRGIYIAHAFLPSVGIKKLFAEGDIVEADVGPTVILQRENFPGFAGNVDLNNRNEIVFSAILASVDRKWIFGTAIYKLHPL